MASRRLCLLSGAALPVLLLLALRATSVDSQADTPLRGRGLPPEDGADIYVSAYLDRLLDVDDKAYNHEDVLYVWMSWNDSRAKDALYVDTNTNGDCTYPCQHSNSPDVEQICCDDVWLPHFDLRNVQELPEGRVERYGVGVDFTENGTGVYRWVSIHGIFYTPMEFRSFPFDHQDLLIEMHFSASDLSDAGSEDFRLIPSATGPSIFTERDGDDVSGWKVDYVEITNFTIPFRSQFEGGRPPHPNEAFAIADLLDVAEPLIGVNINIRVSRLSGYYIMNGVLPVVLIVYLAFIVPCIKRKNLDTRIGIVVTLFLALTALQFVVSSTLPYSSYIVPPQQLVLLSYATLAAVGGESLLVYYLSTYAYHSEKHCRLQRARTRAQVSKSARRQRMGDMPSWEHQSSMQEGRVMRLPGALATVVDDGGPDRSSWSGGSLRQRRGWLAEESLRRRNGEGVVREEQREAAEVVRHADDGLLDNELVAAAQNELMAQEAEKAEERSCAADKDAAEACCDAEARQDEDCKERQGGKQTAAAADAARRSDTAAEQVTMDVMEPAGVGAAAAGTVSSSLSSGIPKGGPDASGDSHPPKLTSPGGSRASRGQGWPSLRCFVRWDTVQQFADRLREDQDFGELLASRVDQWGGLSLFAAYNLLGFGLLLHGALRKQKSLGGTTQL